VRPRRGVPADGRAPTGRPSHPARGHRIDVPGTSAKVGTIGMAIRSQRHGRPRPGGL
ncbi:MAG: hypothetical protein AVDCRST_MAG88-687, partial [uncultured Thermomicrobiales bacterium]